MATSVTFETAAIADAIKKAGLVAPTRGEAFDKANGIAKKHYLQRAGELGIEL